MGLVSKQILEKINAEMRRITSLNQWENTTSVIKWFKNIPNKASHIFTIFDIDSFYPSIAEKLLTNAINYAKQYVKINSQETNIIMHSRKSLLFDQGTMGSYDGAEICELVGLNILDQLGSQYNKENIGLYGDDGLAVFENVTGPQAERIKKDIQKFFVGLGLKIVIKTNLKIVDFLDVTFDLSKETYSPSKKTRKPAALHQNPVQPPTNDNQAPTYCHQQKNF